MHKILKKISLKIKKIRGGDGLFVQFLLSQESLERFKRLRKSAMYDKNRKLIRDVVLLAGTSLGKFANQKDIFKNIGILVRNRKYSCKYFLNLNSTNLINIYKVNLKSIVKNLGSEKKGRKKKIKN